MVKGGMSLKFKSRRIAMLRLRCNLARPPKGNAGRTKKVAIKLVPALLFHALLEVQNSINQFLEGPPSSVDSVRLVTFPHLLSMPGIPHRQKNSDRGKRQISLPPRMRGVVTCQTRVALSRPTFSASPNLTTMFNAMSSDRKLTQTKDNLNQAHPFGRFDRHCVVHTPASSALRASLHTTPPRMHSCPTSTAELTSIGQSSRPPGAAGTQLAQRPPVPSSRQTVRGQPAKGRPAPQPVDERAARVRRG